MAHETPHTDRTPDATRTDPRPGDHVTYESMCGRITATLGHDDLGAARRLASDLDAVFRPRCLATDPRPGDTVVWGAHGEHREVVKVTADEVWFIDAQGHAASRHPAAWEVGAGRWTACRDRKGGARFDPQVGDRAYAGGDVGWEVTERVGDLLGLVAVTSDARTTCPVEVWAGTGLFPARYVRAVRE